MARIGILGSGRVGSTIGSALAARHDIIFGVRDPGKAQAGWRGPAATFASPVEAARSADILFNATPGETSVDRLTALRSELAGKILVDVANATGRGPDGMPAGLLYPEDSLAERLQGALPDTRVVKTLNTMLFTVMANPTVLATRPTAFLSGNDQQAKSTVTALLHDLGWSAEMVEDLGAITTARGPEATVLLVPALIRKHGFAPFAVSLAR